MTLDNLIEDLINSLCYLPGIGRRSANRLAFFLLRQENQAKAKLISQNISTALENIQYCQKCRNLSSLSICNICSNHNRDSSKICIVETPLDILLLENLNFYKGKYFVLHYLISPIDGIGPKEINLALLHDQTIQNQTNELIFALNFSPESEATMYLIAQKVKDKVLNISSLAKGVPIGGELEYIDSSTMEHAFINRDNYKV